MSGIKKEWKKDEKELYGTKSKPVALTVPNMKFFMLEGQGNPNDAFFADCIEALYGASYGLRMSYKQGTEPAGFYEYTVYPLEGVWDLTEAGRQTQLTEGGHLDKNELVFKLMIRQPDFVTKAWAETHLPALAAKRKNPLMAKVQYVEMAEGLCIQMLHEGPYDDEPASFAAMEAFCEANHMKRLSKVHREIYLSDARKVTPDKLKTILRFQAVTLEK